MRARYAAAIVFILCATAFPAFAGPTYQMVGGICTDGSTDDNGQLLCNPNRIFVTVEMREGYVPGTFFFEDSASDPQSVAFFSFSDGSSRGSAGTGFPVDCCGGNIGRIGGAPHADFLQFHWPFDGPNFEADSYGGGRWFFSTPKSPDPGDVYFSSGTYDYWYGPRAPVAEPQSLALVGVALATLVLVRSRRSRVRMRA